jgi:hypothetical protein
MSLYDIYVYCNECRNEHPMGMIYCIEHGPAEKLSLGGIYQGTPLPPQAQAVEVHKTLCPKTGKGFTQKDRKQIFLVPTSSTISNYP